MDALKAAKCVCCSSRFVASLTCDVVLSALHGAALPSDESFRLIKKVQDATDDVTAKLTDVGNARKTEILAS